MNMATGHDMKTINVIKTIVNMHCNTTF